MSSSNNTTTLTWSSSASVSLSTASLVDSDTIIFNVEDWDGALSIKADNQGTPAAGDVVDIYIKWSTDGTNFDSNEHAEYWGRLDTYPTNTPGEDPAQLTRVLAVSGKKAAKIGAIAPQGASRTILLSGSVNTHRGQ